MDSGREGQEGTHFHKVKPGLMSRETGAGRCWEDAAGGSHEVHCLINTSSKKRH